METTQMSIKCGGYIHAVKHYLATERDEALIHAKPQMDFKAIMTPLYESTDTKCPEMNTYRNRK